MSGQKSLRPKSSKLGFQIQMQVQICAVMYHAEDIDDQRVGSSGTADQGSAMASGVMLPDISF